MEIKTYSIQNDGSFNLILGMSHFIKTVDDLAEIVVTTVPGAKYGIAFNEASGPCLTRHEGNDKGLRDRAIDIMQNIKAGHCFAIVLKDCYPINLLSKIKMCDEVCRIFCATTNSISILTVEEGNGAGIVGIIDGVSPKGIETEEDVKTRRDFLKKIGYKF